MNGNRYYGVRVEGAKYGVSRLERAGHQPRAGVLDAAMQSVCGRLICKTCGSDPVHGKGRG